MRARRLVAALFVAGALSLPAWGMGRNETAVPGSLNYVEGSASIGEQALDSKSVGSAQLETGQSLTTEQGKAELLLTPGVFLRVGNSSAVKMVSPSLTNTEVELEQGHAIVEVDEIHPENNIRINAGTSTTRLLKTGLYDFDLRRSSLMVFDGKAEVREGDAQTTVKGGHEVALNDHSAKLKAYRFDKKANEEGDLYRWSSLRSSYLAEANVDAAGLYAVNGAGPWGPGWWGTAWYWDPWFNAFTFIPGDGIFYSPFGWGFYSPWLVYGAPFWGYGWGGYGYHPYVHHFGENVRNWGPGSHYVASAGYTHGIYRGAGSSGAFRSGSRSMMGSARASGGFQGGRVGGGGGGFHGGGFHGGGFSGGFHGR
jgi:FecR protein